MHIDKAQAFTDLLKLLYKLKAVRYKSAVGYVNYLQQLVWISESKIY